MYTFSTIDSKTIVWLDFFTKLFNRFFSFKSMKVKYDSSTDKVY